MEEIDSRLTEAEQVKANWTPVQDLVIDSLSEQMDDLKVTTATGRCYGLWEDDSNRLWNWYLLCCRIFKNELRPSRTCSRLSVAQRASSDERACLFRQPCKTGLTSCTGDGNSCKFNCYRGNTPCKRLTPVLTCLQYKDYRVSKRPDPRSWFCRELLAEYAKSHWWHSCCCCYNG